MVSFVKSRWVVCNLWFGCGFLRDWKCVCIMGILLVYGWEKCGEFCENEVKFWVCRNKWIIVEGNVVFCLRNMVGWDGMRNVFYLVWRLVMLFLV